jgi:RHS repeat-associated protein
MIYENNTLKRILVDGGYIEGSTYYFYLTDHLGNNRVVANMSGTVQQTNHYYPYGMTFDDSTSPAVQPYKYGGKEFDKERSLNWSNFEARQYMNDVPRFTTMDPLAEKYPSISPYAYVAGNPINLIDPDGREVIALNGAAQQAILNTLPKDIRGSVIFNKNGSIDKFSFNSISSASGNFTALSQLVNDNKIFEVNVADKITYKNENGQLIEQSMGEITLSDDKNGSFGFNTGEDGWQGVTQTPGNAPEKYNSPDGNVKIVVNSGLSVEGQAQNFAHEGYGHAYLYSKGTEHKHQVKSTPDGFRETNKALSDAISKAIEETIKNMGGN